MKLHREAFPTLFFAFITLALFNLGSWLLFRGTPYISSILFYLSLALFFVMIYFFRVPTEVPPIGSDLIASPAYGKVVEIVTEEEPTYFKEVRKRISIFMSPLDIHCNYVSTPGQIQFAKHFPGKYLVAFHPKSSLLNEHTFTVIQNKDITIGLKQIAGFMARRIVPYMQEGMEVNQNDELGFIKFGSRLDIFLPPTMDVMVSVGEKVKGGITPIATIV